MAICSVCGVKLTFRTSRYYNGQDYCKPCLDELEGKEAAREGGPAVRTETGRLTNAALLGLGGFVVYMFVGETVFFRLGQSVLTVLLVTAVLGAYFCSCQFVLSRGRSDAWRKDWPVVLALVGPPLALMSPALAFERREVILVQGSIMLTGCSASYAGAVAASLWARRKRPQRAASSQPVGAKRE